MRRNNHSTPRPLHFADTWMILLVVFTRRWRRLGGHVRNRRHQIGETLANAGARLDHQVVAIDDRPLRRVGHRQLLGSMLVARQPSRDSPRRAQNGSWRNHCCENSENRGIEEPKLQHIDYSAFLICASCCWFFRPSVLRYLVLWSSADDDRVSLQPMWSASPRPRRCRRQECSLS